MYSLQNLLSSGYWFSEPLVSNSQTLLIMLAVFGAMIAASVILFFLVKGEKVEKILGRGLLRVASLLVWMGILGFVYLFFRYESAAFFSRRFWLGLWAIGLIVWVVFIVRFFMLKMPQLCQAKAEQERLKKYLPH